MSEHILRRLKEQTPYTNVLDGELMKEAAAEITRLREEVESLKSEESCNDVLLEYAQAETQRLREENARLRAALEGLQEILARKYEIRTDIEGRKEDE